MEGARAKPSPAVPPTATLSSHSVPREREGLLLLPLGQRASQGTGLRVAWSGQNQDSDPGPTQSLLGVLCIRSVSASARGLPLPSPERLFPTELAVGPGGHTGWGCGMLIQGIPCSALLFAEELEHSPHHCCTSCKGRTQGCWCSPHPSEILATCWARRSSLILVNSNGRGSEPKRTV